MSIDVSSGGEIRSLHPRFAEKDFLFRDQEAGVIRTRLGTRALHLPEDFIVGLLEGLEEEVGDAGGMILYAAGYQWGMEDMKSFENQFAAEFGGRTSIREANLVFVLEQWWWPLTAEGWGTWKVDLSARSDGLIFVELYDSAIAKSIGNVGKPVCYIYAGMFSAVFTYLAKRELSSIEIQCYAQGNDYCKFVVGAEKRINAASFWVQEGATGQEIASRLR